MFSKHGAFPSLVATLSAAVGTVTVDVEGILTGFGNAGISICAHRASAGR